MSGPRSVVADANLSRGSGDGGKQIQWDENEEFFRAWEEARTGYPWIDAIMVQLREQGWMHHLARHCVVGPPSPRFHPRPCPLLPLFPSSSALSAPLPLLGATPSLSPCLPSHLALPPRFLPLHLPSPPTLSPSWKPFVCLWFSFWFFLVFVFFCIFFWGGCKPSTYRETCIKPLSQ